MYRICYAITKKYVVRTLLAISVELAALVLSAPFTLLLLLLHCAHFVYKWTLLVIHHRRRHSQFSGVGAKILTGRRECGWVTEDGWQESVVQAAALVFDSKISVRRIQELMTSRVIPAYPRLTHKMCPLPLTAGSARCWLPDERYDINRHVFADDVHLSDDRLLRRYVSALLGEKLAADKPPWELRVVFQSAEADCSSTDTVLILRIHRCLADGMTLVKVLCTKLVDTTATCTAFKSRFKFGHYLRLARAFCVGPAMVIYKSVRAYGRRPTRPTTAAAASAEAQRRRRAAYAVHWSTGICASKVDRIQRVTRSSHNCVFLSAVTGALRYVLQDSGVKHPPDLEITLPLSGAANGGGSADADAGANASGNASAALGVPVSTLVPVSMEGAIPRLWRTKRLLESSASSRNLLVASFVSRVLMPLCPAVYAPSLRSILRESASVQFGSIVGPATRLVIDGSPLKVIYPLVPCQSDVGISVAVSTYVDQVFICVITHSSLDKMGKMLVRLIEEQMERMHSLLVNRSVPEDLGDDYFHNQLPDISELSVKELKSRMLAIQRELQRLSEVLSYNEDDVKRFCHFKSEFHHVFKELRRRKSAKMPRRSAFVTQTAKQVGASLAASKSAARMIFSAEGEMATRYDEESGHGSARLSNAADGWPPPPPARSERLDLEEAIRIVVYNKLASACAFKGRDRCGAENKYAYSTLVDQNRRCDDRTEQNVAGGIAAAAADDDDDECVDVDVVGRVVGAGSGCCQTGDRHRPRHYLSPFSADHRASNRKLFYDSHESEQII